MSIVMGMQNFTKIYQKVQGLGPVLLFFFQNLNLGQTTTYPKYHLTISLATLDNINMYAKFHHNFFHSSRDSAVFRIWSSVRPRPIKNVSSQSLGQDLVNINVYKKVYQIFHSVQEIEPFSLFQNLALGKASTDDKCHFAIPWARSFQHQIVCKILSKYSKRFES